MIKPKFNLGDTVYMASYEAVYRNIVCPDCLGSKRVKVVLGDGTEVSIECGGCDPGGYEPSTGYVRQVNYEIVVHKRTVTGVTLSSIGVEYQLDKFDCSYYTGTDATCFATEQEANQKAESDKTASEAEENKRLMAKTKDHKSWAWNATYHRKCAKNAKRELEYHEDKARICAKNAKESI